MIDQSGIRHKGRFWATAVMVLVLFGCTTPEPEIKIVTLEERSQSLVKELRLPSDAKNVTQLNNGWHTFELAIDGRTRKFLRRSNSWEIDTVTELTPQ